MEYMEKKEWRDEIEGFECKAIFWTRGGMDKLPHVYPHKGIWNGYLTIYRKQIPRQFDSLVPPVKNIGLKGMKRRLIFDYSSLGIDMDGGMTYYHPYRDIHGKITAVEIGNDYNHIWNEGQYIDQNVVFDDLRKVAQQLKNRFPNFLVRSWIDGNYVKPERLEAYNQEKNAELNKRYGRKDDKEAPINQEIT